MALSPKIEIGRNKERIVKLLNRNVDLEYQMLLDKCHKFHEKEVNYGSRDNEIMKTVKYGSYFEYFKDKKDTNPRNKGVKIERNIIVSINGERYIGLNPVSYFTAENL